MTEKEPAKTYVAVGDNPTGGIGEAFYAICEPCNYRSSPVSTPEVAEIILSNHVGKNTHRDATMRPYGFTV